MSKKYDLLSLQASLFEGDFVTHLELNHPLVQLANRLDWNQAEANLLPLYSDKGKPITAIRQMLGLMILKQIYHFSDETVVSMTKMSHYFQYFCGIACGQLSEICHSASMSKFRKRIGQEGCREIFALSVKIFGKLADEPVVIVDTTVQEKYVTYPTDVKSALKAWQRLLKLAKKNGIVLRRSYKKLIKQLRIKTRMNHNQKNKEAALDALAEIRNIVAILMRELERKLDTETLSVEAENFANYHHVITQEQGDSGKIYALHEPHIYCVRKGKAGKRDEYGVKASIVKTLKNHIIVGVMVHEKNEHDSKLLTSVLDESMNYRNKPIKTASLDRGYQGCKRKVDCEVVIPGPKLVKDSEKECERKRFLCQKRSGIEPVIGHLKNDYGLTKNRLKGFVGDGINLLMSACAWNLKKWMRMFEKNKDILVI